MFINKSTIVTKTITITIINNKVILNTITERCYRFYEILLAVARFHF